MLYRLIVAAVLLAALALVSGCSSGCPRTADPASGDFYTEEEYKKCTKEQAAEYCAALLAEYDANQGCIEQATADLDRENRAMTDLESELDTMTPQLMALRGEVETLEREIAYYEGLPRMYTVTKGDFLYKISEMEEIYADPLKWKRIWRANKDVIDEFNDPNLIYPDWELVIPRDWPYSYTVKGGENLWQIAAYWEIYGDGRMWTRIFEANKDEISNPDIIQPGQMLNIPR
jgi:hypothetical protein